MSASGENYNTSDIMPMEPWTEQNWNAIEFAKKKREEMKKQMSKKALELQEQMLEERRKREQEKKQLEEKKQEEEAKKVEAKKAKAAKKAKTQPKKEEHISLMPSKKELKRAEQLRRERQREEDLKAKEKKEEEANVVEEVKVVEKKKRGFPWLFAVVIVVVAVVLYRHYDLVEPLYNQLLAKLSWCVCFWSYHWDIECWLIIGVVPWVIVLSIIEDDSSLMM